MSPAESVLCTCTFRAAPRTKSTVRPVLFNVSCVECVMVTNPNSLIGRFLLRGRDADQRDHLRGCDASVRGAAAGRDAPGPGVPPTPTTLCTRTASPPYATPSERPRNARTQTPSSSRWGRYHDINPRAWCGVCSGAVSHTPSCTSSWLS